MRLVQANLHQDSSRMVLWASLSRTDVERWLVEAGVDPLNAVLASHDLSQDLVSWLYRRGARVPAFGPLFKRAA